LGITTWQRPEMFRECRDSVIEHLSGVLDVVVVLQDGGECYSGGNPLAWHHIDQGVNRGWATAKNTCLQYLLAQGCEHLFMIEDDTLVTSPRAVSGYVDAAVGSGLHYLTAHPWGETETRKVGESGAVTYWAYVGSWWTYMSAVGLEAGGGYNETLGGIMDDHRPVHHRRPAGLERTAGVVAQLVVGDHAGNPAL
jgi:hypothetical protein